MDASDSIATCTTSPALVKYPGHHCLEFPLIGSKRQSRIFISGTAYQPVNTFSGWNGTERLTRASLRFRGPKCFLELIERVNFTRQLTDLK